MSAPLVAARGLHQAYGRQPALRGVDLEVRAGEAVALLGENGAGKSTLLRILSTMERPRRGEVTFADGLADEALRAAIGVVAHESLCYADLSARENLRFFGALYAVPELPARIETLLRRVALDHAADRPARTYSRGMLQRLAVARALVHAPRLLLLDEPFTGLDRQGAALLTRILSDEKARGAAIVVVSHDLPAIAPFVDRALVLARGRVERAASLPPPGSGEDRLAALEHLYDDAAARGAA